MLIKTKCFGEIDITEDKVVRFEQGLFGFETYKDYTILYDSEGNGQEISWLQSMDEPALALPVIVPTKVVGEYNPIIEEALLENLGDVKEEDIAAFVIMTVPSDITKATVNLKAPLIVNAETRKGMQVVVENKEYEVKHNIYGKFSKNKEESVC